ncbi:low molecular weight protein-tyrosine-phosphatase [Streptomyces sp. NPDC051776]|uniref:low molecular weight protein-tyrosine-phosphatase n=1 Tax=Streptomyces sp. NPDC051776 TaxID=3155414 RepID=UPI003420DC8F
MSPSSRHPYRVCFVCTGNICRSPMAAAVFRARVEEAGLGALIEVDSAGTGGWFEGEEADGRAVETLLTSGYTSGHTARRFRQEWFAERDLVIALDRGHLRELRALAPTPEDRAKVRLLLSHADDTGDGLDVPDPYYGDREGFEHALALIEPAAAALLEAVRPALDNRQEAAHDR